MIEVERKIDKLGRIVLPMDFRKALGLKEEESVCISVSADAITIKAVKSNCKICACASDVSIALKICSKCIEKIKND